MKGNLADITTPGLRSMFPVEPRPNGSAGPPRPARPEAVAPVELPADAVLLGRSGVSPFGIRLPKLLEGRLLVQGQSGAGKSWLLRKLLEESAGRVQQIIIDPDGEFRSLAEMLDYPVAEGHRLDLDGATALAGRVREHRLSVVLDLSELDREQQMLSCAYFLTALIGATQEHWHPAIVAIDEAHIFAPLGTQGYEAASIRRTVTSAVVDLMSRGRKRGLAPIIATQRFARLSKSVASEVQNFMIGINTLDVDIRRAAETIGWDARRAFDRLPGLQSGEFIPVGPAFSPNVSVEAKIGRVRSRHTGMTPDIAAPQNRSAGDGAELLGLAKLAKQAEEGRDESGLPIGARVVRQFIRDPAFPLAGQLFQALRPLYPEGTGTAALAKHFKVKPEKVVEALALLEVWAAVETRGTAPEITVRIHPTIGRS